MVIHNSPVTEITHENLTNNDTSNFKVGNGSNPVRIADGVLLPAGGESLLKQRSDVANRKEDITMIISDQSKIEFPYLKGQSMIPTLLDRDPFQGEPHF
jgi:hypothetical protein